MEWVTVIWIVRRQHISPSSLVILLSRGSGINKGQDATRIVNEDHPNDFI